MAKNILILSNNINGLYSFRREVILAIAQEGYQVYISIPDFESSRVGYFEDNDCHIIPTRFNRRCTNVTGLGDAVENGGWLQKLTINLYKMDYRRKK